MGRDDGLSRAPGEGTIPNESCDSFGNQRLALVLQWWMRAIESGWASCIARSRAISATNGAPNPFAGQSAGEPPWLWRFWSGLLQKTA